MRTIFPCFWFDNNAEEATDFYLGLFPGGELLDVQRKHPDVPGTLGAVLATHLRIADLELYTINGGTEFAPSPSLSLFVESSDLVRLDALWAALSDGGQVMMEYGDYPWAAKYGWLNDRYGVSWQLSAGEHEEVAITPALLFTGEQFGKLESAIHRWVSVFPNSDSGIVIKREGMGDPSLDGTVMFSRFTLGGQPVVAMEDNSDHRFGFTYGVSLVVQCDDQAETDRIWDALIADGGEPSMCGWLLDPYGVPWQVWPDHLVDLFTSPDTDAVERATQAMYQMQKLDIATLRRAFAGE